MRKSLCPAIKFYQLNKCGFYGRGDTQPEFGSIAEILEDLNIWVKSKGNNLLETCPFEPRPNEDLQYVLCAAISHDPDTKDYVISTFNNTAALGGTVYYLDTNAPFNKPQYSTNTAPRNHLTGYPSFFWFLPERNLFATVIFGGQLNGHRGLMTYMKHFISKFSRFTVYSEAGTEILGYKPPSSNVPPKSMKGYFESQPVYKPGKKEYLLNNYNKILRIRRRETLRFTNESQRNRYSNFWRGVFGQAPEVAEEYEKVDIEYSMKMKLSKEMITQALDLYDKSPKTDWNDYIFDLPNNESLKLSSSLAKANPNLTVKTIAQDVVDVNSLLDSLLKNREGLLSKLNL